MSNEYENLTELAPTTEWQEVSICEYIRSICFDRTFILIRFLLFDSQHIFSGDDDAHVNDMNPSSICLYCFISIQTDSSKLTFAYTHDSIEMTEKYFALCTLFRWFYG